MDIVGGGTEHSWEGFKKWAFNNTALDTFSTLSKKVFISLLWKNVANRF